MFEHTVSHDLTPFVRSLLRNAGGVDDAPLTMRGSKGIQSTNHFFRKDQCPNEAEVVNGVDDTDGCPDEGGLVEVDCKEIKIKDRVFFATGKDTIRKQSHKLLDAVADVLKAQPRIKKIRIEGHTDDVGDEDNNKKLSEARAEAVKAYLVAKGVDTSRIDTKGYGESRPIVKLIDGGGNKLRGKGLKTARASNRRVEFAIVDQEPCKETKKAP